MCRPTLPTVPRPPSSARRCVPWPPPPSPPNPASLRSHGNPPEPCSCPPPPPRPCRHRIGIAPAETASPRPWRHPRKQPRLPAVARDSRRRRRGARRPGPGTDARPPGRTWRVVEPPAGSGPARDEPAPGAASPPQLLAYRNSSQQCGTAHSRRADNCATRTPGLRFRKPPLYPPELQGRNL